MCAFCRILVIYTANFCEPPDLQSVDEADTAINLANQLGSQVIGLLCAVCHALGQIGFISDQARKLGADRFQVICDCFTDRDLEVAVALAGKLCGDLIHGLAGDGAVNGHEIVDAVLALFVADLGIGIGDGALEFAQNGILIVEDVDAAVCILIGLGHLLGRILNLIIIITY